MTTASPLSRFAWAGAFLGMMTGTLLSLTWNRVAEAEGSALKRRARACDCKNSGSSKYACSQDKKSCTPGGYICNVQCKS